MSIKSKIGILINDPDDQDGYFEVVRQTDAVRSGAVEVLALNQNPNFDETQGLICAVVTGVGRYGRNVHSAFYTPNISPSEPIPDTDYVADLRVLGWLSMFAAHRVPVVATCLGLQLAWVFRGGKLKAGIAGHTGTTPDEHTTTTTVSLTPDSLLAQVAGRTTLDMKCMHSQGAALPPTPPELTVTGYSADGEIHAVESEDGLLAATQSHPEKMLEDGFGLAYYNEIFGRCLRWGALR